MKEIKPYLLNWIFNNAKKGAKPPKLQEKEIAITENGTTTVTADQGYDGLSDVDVTVSGILDTSDATATEEDIVNPKTAYVNGVKLSGQLRKSNSLTFTDLERIQIVGNRLNLSGLTTRRTLLDANRNVNFRPLLSDVAPVIGAEASKIKKDEVICGVTGTYEGEGGTKAVLPDGIKFQGSDASNMDFLNNVDSSNVTNMSYMFSGCSYFTTIPLLNTSNVKNMTNMFSNCSSLSNDSLNNILAMCANTTSAYRGAKTLTTLGLSQTQAETCQTLSNWDAFVAAGWSSGY